MSILNVITTLSPTQEHIWSKKSLLIEILFSTLFLALREWKLKPTLYDAHPTYSIKLLFKHVNCL